MAHRKTLKRFHEPGDLHEFTFSCYHSKPFLTNDDWRTRLSECVDAAGNAESINLVAFVYMPNHVHLLVHPTTLTPNLGRYLARVKQPFSKQIKEILKANKAPLLKQLTVRERPSKYCFRFWQEGAGYDRNLNTPRAIRASIDYIHANPCRKNLCERAIEWPWSSARYYLLEPGKQQFDGLPTIAGLPEGVFDDA